MIEAAIVLAILNMGLILFLLKACDEIKGMYMELHETCNELLDVVDRAEKAGIKIDD